MNYYYMNENEENKFSNGEYLFENSCNNMVNFDLENFNDNYFNEEQKKEINFQLI